MIRSMTGFGMGSVKLSDGLVTVEIKTVNHKFFEMTSRLPNNIATFDEKVKDIIHRKVRRGKVNLNLIYEGELVREEKISLNKAMAKSYYRELLNLKKTLRLKGDIVVDDLILFPGVLNHEVKEANLLGLWPGVKKAVDKALSELVSDREGEGRALYGDLIKRVKGIRGSISKISARSESNVREYKNKLAKRIRELTGGQAIDSGRLEMEVAIYAKNCDISEELARLKNHLLNFEKTATRGGEAGKKLDFIAQELHREANTIGSKASDYRVSRSVIDIKTEIEKIREQVKNIE